MTLQYKTVVNPCTATINGEAKEIPAPMEVEKDAVTRWGNKSVWMKIDETEYIIPRGKIQVLQYHIENNRMFVDDTWC